MPFNFFLKQLPSHQRKLLRNYIHLSQQGWDHLIQTPSFYKQGTVLLYKTVIHANNWEREEIKCEVYRSHDPKNTQESDTDLIYVYLSYDWHLYSCHSSDWQKLIKALKAWAVLECTEAKASSPGDSLLEDFPGYPEATII